LIQSVKTVEMEIKKISRIYRFAAALALLPQGWRAHFRPISAVLSAKIGTSAARPPNFRPLFRP
jgi:hypothetical protein